MMWLLLGYMLTHLVLRCLAFAFFSDLNDYFFLVECEIAYPASATCLVQLYLAALEAMVVVTEEEDASDDTACVLDLWQGLVHALTSASSAHRIKTVQQTVMTWKWKPAYQTAIVQHVKDNPSLVAVVLVHYIDTTVNWTTDVLLPWSVATWPTTADFERVRGVWIVPITDWTEHLSPLLLQRVKSHPDKAWPVAAGWMTLVDSSGATSLATDEWMDMVIGKALVHASQEAWRAVAQQILVEWARRSTGDAAWMSKVVAGAPPNLAPTRTHVYRTLFDMAQAATTTETAAASILSSLANTWWPKETKSEGKGACLQAGLAFLKTSDQVQDSANKVWWTTVMSKATDAGFVLSQVMATSSSTVPAMMAAMHAAQPKATAWQGLVESAQTKKTVQYEGILALYATIQAAYANNSKVPAWVSKIMTAASTKASAAADDKKLAFVWQSSTWDSVLAGSTDNVGAAAALAQALALYTQMNGNDASGLWTAGGTTCAAQALAYILLFPGTGAKPIAEAVASIIESAGVNGPSCIASAALSVMNRLSLETDERRFQINATRQSRETESLGLSSARTPTFALIRQVVAQHALMTTTSKPQRLAQALILLHAGTVAHSQAFQRHSLVKFTEQALEKVAKDPNANRTTVCEELCQEILQWITCLKEENKKDDENATTSEIVPTAQACHEAAVSILTSVGKVASKFAPDTDEADDPDLQAAVLAHSLCTVYLAPRLSAQLSKALGDIENLTVKDVDIYLSPLGTLVVEEDKSNDKKGPTKKHLTEDEQWELQIKKELAEKKQQTTSGGASHKLTVEDQAKVKAQDEQRGKTRNLVEQHYTRILEGIRSMALSDIEVGNSCLPAFARPVLQATVSQCPLLERLQGLSRQGSSLLLDFATCVYEIDESVAPDMADALQIACRREKRDLEPHEQAAPDSTSNLVSQPLPSPCDPAAKVFQELDDFHDVLSGASFFFLFPVIQASLMGPRTSPGCESSVSILGMHTELLAGEEADQHVLSIRKEMVLSLLELLKHDRHQTFQHPSAMDVLVDCFNADTEGPSVLSTADLAPLLDQNGALGSTTCRVGAMLALKSIATNNQKLVKNNPLVENRIWLNCFSKNDEIKSAARQAWNMLKNGAEGDDALPAPSPVYAAPLIPLLNASNESIAEAAAAALAHAMSYHPNSVGRNIENLCKLYIESYPSTTGPPDETASVSSASTKTTTIAAPKPVKKPISTGLPKKKSTGKKSALAIAGIGKPKAGTKKKSTGAAAAALLKPKQERTLDQADLVGQFTATPSKAKGEKDTPAKMAVRLGVLQAITAATATEANVDMDVETLKQLTSFLMAYGLAESDDKVKSVARDTLRDVVANKGGSDEAIAFLLPQLETVLKSGETDDSSLKALPTEKVARDVSASDRRKEGAVVALGSVALHLKGPANESKIDSTVDMLLAALKTPSEDVQSSVADALTKLMKKGNTQARFETIISDLLRDCLFGDSLATRRGAAYGLSAAVKGGGIATLKKFDVVKKLEESCDTGNASSKEGSLFAMELLSRRLGLLFEPYVIVLLPSLLKSFSDGSDFVRKAASNTAGLIMSKLSAHGVKLVMPAVLESFDEAAWRTKQASIQMLGSMSHLAPKQLASALPKVVPKLTEAFSDTHPKVKTSAQEALNEISTVIRNPEIKGVSPILLKALTDPADYTQTALESLIATEFLHAIDAPSLALIVPILHRGLRDRGATVKRMGGLIAGNICTMINEPRDFVPYLPTLLPDLQTALLDPIPDVRNTSAKALGTLARSLGDHILPELRPWLVQKLREKQCSSAERSGAAQGLTEVLIASGSEAVDEVLRNELLPLSSHPEASTREGVLWMITFLPPAMGQNFSPYIDVSLGPLVKGLSDDNENVRDVAMRAGRVLIRSHGKVHMDKILPSLEEGLEDDDHRIRLASLSLLGDLLSTIGGTTVLRGDGDTQDDIRKAERAQAQIALALGPDTRRRVLSRLYMARSDTVHAVRQSAIQIWKTVVSVTARALRDILSVLVNLIVENLASGHEERTVVAGQCLGDVVTKLGEMVLPQIIPVLRKSLYEGDEHTKRGVCVGLTDVIKCCSKEQIIRFLEIITKLVQDALSDDDEEVRSMASQSFQGLYTLVGTRAFDEIVPSLMVSLANDNDETAQRHALNGLTGILAVRSRELLPYIIPRLISRPITSNHARALSRISVVTGATIHKHFPAIIPALLLDLSEGDTDEERLEALRECSRAICGSVHTEGVQSLVSEIATKCNSDKASIRRESCLLFQATVARRTSTIFALPFVTATCDDDKNIRLRLVFEGVLQ